MAETENTAPDTTDGLLSTVEVAKAFNVTRGAVQNWINDGCPVEVRSKGRNPNLLDLAKVRAWKASKSGKLNPQDERARKDKAQADNVEIRNQVLLGKLVDADDVIEHWADMVGAARAKLLALPTRLATIAVACNDLEEIQDGAEKLVREVLEELARDPVPSQEGVESAAGPDGKSVGGPVPEAEPGGVSGAGPVED